MDNAPDTYVMLPGAVMVVVDVIPMRVMGPSVVVICPLVGKFFFAVVIEPPKKLCPAAVTDPFAVAFHAIRSWIADSGYLLLCCALRKIVGAR